MIYNEIQGVKVSALGMGNMRLPAVDPNVKGSPIDYLKAHEIIDHALANGINYFDTAYVYTGSEECLGACMTKHDRDSFYLASKFHIGSNPDYEAVFAESLRRLQTNRIDFYLLHCLLDNNIDTYLESGAIPYFEKKKEEGAISYLGFSSHASVDVLRRYADYRKWDFAQIQLNYYDWWYGTAKEEYEILTERNIPIVVMEPVRGGRLASLNPEAEAVLKAAHPDWSISSWALRFVKSLPNVKVILSGMSHMDQIKDNLNTFSVEEGLSDADMATLKEACDLFRKSMQVPCTGCRYCTEGCPVQINIPEYMKVYNDYKVNGRDELKKAADIDTEGTPADCVGCGACEAACPQSIKIPEIMAELAELLK